MLRLAKVLRLPFVRSAGGRSNRREAPDKLTPFVPTLTEMPHKAARSRVQATASLDRISRAVWHPSASGIGQGADSRFLRTALSAPTYSKSPSPRLLRGGAPAPL